MKVLTVFGTRPEAIKMAPLVKKFNDSKTIESFVCVTAQHRQMLDQVLDIFNIVPNYDLDIMRAGQSISYITAAVLSGLESVISDCKPDLLLVHGDTTTTFAASLSAFYLKVPVAHIEAGLRTWDIYSPWPEELNRTLTSKIATLHFAPTENAKKNLLRDNVQEGSIFVTGNTVIDALMETSVRIDENIVLKTKLDSMLPRICKQKKIILVTCHRRENFGDGLLNVCRAIEELSKRPDVYIVFPVHLNPNIKEIVQNKLGNINNIHLIEPQEYVDFVYLMKKSYIILTDSGGVQEEAPSLGKPVLVMRETTERPEAVESGTVKLVGCNVEKIVDGVNVLLDSVIEYEKISYSHNPYGDGHSSARIFEIIKNRFC